MGSFALPIRLLITCSLTISLSWAGFCPCLPSPQTAAKSSKCGSGKRCGCGCGQTAVGRGCGMACCQKQVPPGNDRDLPKRGDRDQNQFVIKFVPPAGLLSDDAGHGSAIAAIFAELDSRLAPPTLQSQHICMQV